MALVIVALQAFGDVSRRRLAFERSALEEGQVWRLLTSHFVHLGWYHTLLNLLGLLALLVLCPQRLTSREWVARVGWLALWISVALYVAAPAVDRYVGLSGVLHGLFFLGLVPMARRGDAIAIACLAYLFGKLAWEQFAGTPVSDEHAIGGHVVTLAHLFGTLAALVYGFAFGTFRRGVKTQ
jgi:rhomboid family GlyGly-CTERM serine protease